MEASLIHDFIMYLNALNCDGCVSFNDYGESDNYYYFNCLFIEIYYN